MIWNIICKISSPLSSTAYLLFKVIGHLAKCFSYLTELCDSLQKWFLQACWLNYVRAICIKLVAAKTLTCKCFGTTLFKDFQKYSYIKQKKQVQIYNIYIMVSTSQKFHWLPASLAGNTTRTHVRREKHKICTMLTPLQKYTVWHTVHNL